MSRPRVLLLAPTRNTGGIATWASVLVSEATRTDFTVEDTSRTYCAAGQRQTPWHRVRGLATGLARIARVLRRVRRERPGAVFLTCAPSLGFLIRDLPMVLLLRASGTPAIVILHGGDLVRFFGRGGPRTRFTFVALRRADRVIATTREVEAFLAPRIAADVLCYLPNMVAEAYWSAVDPVRRPPPETGRRAVALVAWQSPSKGSIAAVRAMSRLPADVDLLLVGEGSPENVAGIDSAAERAGVADRVHRRGRLSRAEVDRVLAGCEVALLPSATEGFPMAVLEAMSHGVPVVASRVGNLPEILLGDPARPAGLLVGRTSGDPRLPVSPEELGAAIGRLLADPGLARRLGRNGRSRVADEFLSTKVVPQLEDLIAAVTRKRRSPPVAAPSAGPAR